MEASSRCDTEKDTQHGLLGSISLRKKLHDNMNQNNERYHVGDVVYENGDIFATSLASSSGIQISTKMLPTFRKHTFPLSTQKQTAFE